MDNVLALGRLPSLMRFHFKHFRRFFTWDANGNGFDVHEKAKSKLEKGLHIPINACKDDKAFLYVVDSEMYAAMEGLLSSMLIGAWTAFETIAGDLWEATVNARPEQIMQTLIQRNDPPNKGVGKSVPLWVIKKYNYDLSGQMGRVLKERYTFTKLDGLREAYSQAFANTPIVDVVNETAIDALNLIRNVLIHKAGIIDDEFVERAANDQELRGLQKGKALPLDGQFVASKVSPVIQCAVRLFSAADDWLDAPSAP